MEEKVSLEARISAMEIALALLMRRHSDADCDLIFGDLQALEESSYASPDLNPEAARAVGALRRLLKRVATIDRPYSALSGTAEEPPADEQS